MSEKTIEFLAALNNAVVRGDKAFKCPMCGGTAHWARRADGAMTCRCGDCSAGLWEEGE